MLSYNQGHLYSVLQPINEKYFQNNYANREEYGKIAGRKNRERVLEMKDHESKNSYVKTERERRVSIEVVLQFLQLFLPATISRKVVSVILLAAGLSVTEVAEMTGLSSRSVESTGRAIKDGSISSILARKKNSGRKCKTAGVEEQIIAELEQGNYHTRQQIADMIREKFQITVSLPAVGRLLKKTASES